MPLESIQGLPSRAKHIFESVMEGLSGRKNPRTGETFTGEERARIAWSAVKKKYHKTDNGWTEKKAFDRDNYSIYITDVELKGTRFSGILSTVGLDSVGDILTSDVLEQYAKQINERAASGNPILGDYEHETFFNPKATTISWLDKATVKNNGTQLHVEGELNENHSYYSQYKDMIGSGRMNALSIDYFVNDKIPMDDLSLKRVIIDSDLRRYGHTSTPINTECGILGSFIKSFVDAVINKEEFNMENLKASHMCPKCNYEYDEEEETKAGVTAMEEKREKLGMSPNEFYATPRDPPSSSSLPIFDAAHVRNAMARFNQVQGLSPEESATARRKILRAAKKFDIEVGEFGDEKDKKGGGILTEENKPAEPSPSKPAESGVKSEVEALKAEMTELKSKLVAYEKSEAEKKAKEEEDKKYNELKSRIMNDLKTISPQGRALVENTPRFDTKGEWNLAKLVAGAYGG